MQRVRCSRAPVQQEAAHPARVANNRKVSGPQMDIKYGYVAGLRRHFYVASIIEAVRPLHRGLLSREDL
jgi:hypothetical protein